MKNPLDTVTGTLISGVVLALLFAIGTDIQMSGGQGLILWLHVIAGVTWIGLLYYFNVVQVPALAAATADKSGPGGAGITKYVAPRALLWFRWAAVVTWLAGAAYLLETGNFLNAFTLGLISGSGDPGYGLTIGIGAWLGSIMLFNVWILIWPNQKKVLGIVQASPEAVNSARRVAFLASRTNTLLSIPMLMSMLGPHHGFWF